MSFPPGAVADDGRVRRPEVRYGLQEAADDRGQTDRGHTTAVLLRRGAGRCRVPVDDGHRRRLPAAATVASRRPVLPTASRDGRPAAVLLSAAAEQADFGAATASPVTAATAPAPAVATAPVGSTAAAAAIPATTRRGDRGLQSAATAIQRLLSTAVASATAVATAATATATVLPDAEATVQAGHTGYRNTGRGTAAAAAAAADQLVSTTKRAVDQSTVAEQ